CPAGVDEPRDLLQAEHGRQPLLLFGVWQEVAILMPLQGLDEKEPQSGYVVDHASGGQLAFSEQIYLVAAQLVEPKLVRRLPKVLGELGHHPKVMPDRIIGVVSTLEFLQHHL